MCICHTGTVVVEWMYFKHRYILLLSWRINQWLISQAKYLYFVYLMYVSTKLGSPSLVTSQLLNRELKKVLSDILTRTFRGKRNFDNWFLICSVSGLFLTCSSESWSSKQVFSHNSVFTLWDSVAVVCFRSWSRLLPVAAMDNFDRLRSLIFVHFPIKLFVLGLW